MEDFVNEAFAHRAVLTHILKSKCPGIFTIQKTLDRILLRIRALQLHRGHSNCESE